MTASDAGSFPNGLINLQEQLHRAHAKHRVLLAGLPWSVEPIRGWTWGERFSHRGDVSDGPGWSEEEKETVAWRPLSNSPRMPSSSPLRTVSRYLIWTYSPRSWRETGAITAFNGSVMG